MSSTAFAQSPVAPRRPGPALAAACAALAIAAGFPSASAAFVPTSAPTQPAAQPVRATSHWNLDKRSRLALQGYDPVAYFPEGGSKPAKGKPAISADHAGAVYYFASDAHKAVFLANPARYEPAHGGWCSFAMLDAEKVEVDPASFIIKDDRLFLFYNGFLADTRSKWLKSDHAAQAAKADANWLKISGESPHAAPNPPAPSPSSAPPASSSSSTPSAPGPLQSKLDARWEQYKSSLPPERISAIDASVAAIADTGVAARALKTGDTAPAFTLPDAHASPVALKDLLARGPVVLTFYRGSWCPFCNLQLAEYQNHLDEFKALGATLVAVSPETPDESLTTAEKNALAFHVLSDSDFAVTRSFGLDYPLPSSPSARSAEPRSLPVTATYVIDRAGVIRYAFLDTDFRRRAEPADILAALRALR